MAYQRILTIQDISCLGQCSMTVALPILSACGHEVCILPTKVLSTHTGGFQAPAVQDLTDAIPAICAHWHREGITFDLIYTGYLGSIGAIEEVEKLIPQLLAPGGKLIVDPAMADHGKLYGGFDDDYARAMTRLCGRADVVLPNLTEAAMMAALDYQESCDESHIRRLLDSLPGANVVLTGVGFEENKTGAAIRTASDVSFYHHEKLDRSYHGTGDIFASAFVGSLACGKSVEDATRIAADFSLKSIENTYSAPAHWYGVKFETALPELIKLLNNEETAD